MEYLFMCHDPAEAEIVGRLAKRLEAEGYTTWQDTTQGEADGELSRQTVFAIERSDACLVASSPSSMASGRVRRQLEVAQKSGRPIFVIAIEPAAIPPELEQVLADRPAADIGQQFDAGVDQLLGWLSGEAEAPPEIEAEVDILGGGDYGEIARLPDEEIIWSEQGYYWYKKWRNLTRIDALLTNKRLLFVWDTRDSWKWNNREWDELSEVFPISLSLREVQEIGQIQKPKSFLFLTTSAPFFEIKTDDETTHKVTLLKRFEERAEELRQMVRQIRSGQGAPGA